MIQQAYNGSRQCIKEVSSGFEETALHGRAQWLRNCTKEGAISSIQGLRKMKISINDPGSE